MKILDKSLPDVEQVIEVPKILQHTVLQRSSHQEPQLAEQLVDVPTPSPALAPVPQMEHQLVEVPPTMGTCGGSSRGPRAPLTPSGPPTGVHRQARAVKKYWPRVIVDVPVIMLVVFQQSTRFSSSTECRTFQLCHRREIPRCSS